MTGVVWVILAVGTWALDGTYRDASLPIDERVTHLLQQMTVQEKVNQLLHVWTDVDDAAILAKYGSTGVGASYAAPNHKYQPSCTTTVCHIQSQNKLQHALMNQSRLGIPISWIQETLHGGAPFGTVFPMPCALGSTWNAPLIHSIGTVIAREARAIGVDRGFSPELNVCTDPRFGRLEENFSEDPCMVSTMGVAMALGLQGTGGGPSTPVDDQHVVAEAKHFAAYGYGGKDGAPADISLATLHDVYLRPWRAFVQKAGGRAVMAAHNSINGEPCHGSHHWLTETLRQGMGFEKGLIASDFNDIGNIPAFKVVTNTTEAVALAIAAGLDQDLSARWYPMLTDEVASHKVAIADVDRAAGNVLRAKFAAGLFDRPFVDPSQAAGILDNATHRALARQAAEEGSVLLVNRNGALPLRLSSGQTLAIVGPNAGCDTTLGSDEFCEAQRNQCGGYSSMGSHVVTVVEAATARAPTGVKVVHSRGCNINDAKTDFLAHALAVARGADTIVMVGGDTGGLNWDGSTCGEDEDRPSLDLHGGQLELLEALLALNKTTILVLIHGRPATFGGGPAASTRNALLGRLDALLAAWRPGEEGGDAIWSLLTGEANPSGRLAQAWPRTVGYVHTLANPWYHTPQGDFGDSPYIFHVPSTPLFPFGYGLSYTTFAWSGLHVSPSKITSNGNITVTVSVKNIGHQEGQDVVEIYYSQKVAPYVRYERMLCGFVKVKVAPGATVTTRVEVPVVDLGYYHTKEAKHAVDKGVYTIMAATDSSKVVAHQDIEVV